jgi:probable addiction module antidote protein
MRQKELALNAALKTADIKTVCAALEELVRSSPNVSKLAHEAGINRAILYRTFRGKKGPRLAAVVSVLRAAGFRLIVKIERRPKKSTPNRFGQGSKTTAHLELRWNSKASAEFLTLAFETSDLGEIVKALESVLRAQENVVAFARTASLDRQSLYRSFRQSRVPQFSMVLHFLNALGLRLAVVPLMANDAFCDEMNRHAVSN